MHSTPIKQRRVKELAVAALAGCIIGYGLLSSQSTHNHSTDIKDALAVLDSHARDTEAKYTVLKKDHEALHATVDSLQFDALSAVHANHWLNAQNVAKAKYTVLKKNHEALHATVDSLQFDALRAVHAINALNAQNVAKAKYTVLKKDHEALHATVDSLKDAVHAINALNAQNVAKAHLQEQPTKSPPSPHSQLPVPELPLLSLAPAPQSLVIAPPPTPVMTASTGSCMAKQLAKDWGAKGPTTVLLWHPTWINEFFQAPYTNRCPHCDFTTDRSKLKEAHAVLYSTPEMRGENSINDPESDLSSRSRRGKAKVIYMCLEAPQEFDNACFWDLPPTVSQPLGAAVPQNGGQQFIDGFDLFAGHQMCADIPALYPVPTEEMLLKPPGPKTEKAPLSYFSSNCRKERDVWVVELMTYMEVASYGDCLHNRGGDDAGGRTQGFEGGRAAAKMERMGRHKFNIAHEGYSAPYYFSEKLWEPYQAGVIPVYWGAGEWLEKERLLPENSWINAGDKTKFPTVKALADYLTKIEADAKLYDSFFEWKKKPLPQTLVAAMKLDWRNLACNICNAPEVHQSHS